jgi:predicted PurR-regulated permease PerM
MNSPRDGVEPETQVPTDAEEGVPYIPKWLRIGGAWGWRFVATSAAVSIVLYACTFLWMAVLPVLLGGVLATLLEPVARFLRRLSVPRVLAGALSVLLSIVFVVGAGFVFGFGVAEEFSRLSEAMEGGYRQAVHWSAEVAGVSRETVRGWIDHSVGELQSYAGNIAKQVVTGVRGVAQGIAVVAVTLVFTWFFTWDGDKQFEHVVKLLPRNQRPHARELGERIWTTVGGYMRGMVIIAAADAALLGLGLWIIGLPLILPLMLLMFTGAFIPFVGPVVTGVMACLVAFGNGGITTVGFVVLVVVAVQQIEGNLLHPFIMGRAVQLHPAVILFAITAGGVLAGVVGVFLAIPMAASLACIFGYIREQQAE